MTRDASNPAKIAFAGLVAIDIAAAVALAWLVMTFRIFDGFMVVETAICVGLMVALALLTWGAFALKRRARIRAAIALLCVGAVPTALVVGFLVYLDANPIDWK